MDFTDIARSIGTPIVKSGRGYQDRVARALEIHRNTMAACMLNTLRDQCGFTFDSGICGDLGSGIPDAAGQNGNRNFVIQGVVVVRTVDDPCVWGQLVSDAFQGVF